MSIRTLSVHAGYRCRHSGACCTAGWRIPIEPILRQSLGTDLLTPLRDGRCPQFDTATSLCRLQRDGGPEQLPRSCHHFPRLALLDDRGTSVSLSHFCPTAASLLFDSTAPLAIVDDEPPFVQGRDFEGLDGRGQWPPLVRRELLFDLGTYTAWEQFMVATLAAHRSTRAAVAAIAAAAERLRAWTPEHGDFAAYARQSFTSGAEVPLPDCYLRLRTAEAWREILSFSRDASHAELRQTPAVDRHAGWGDHEETVARFLAAKAFASWCAYQARGIRTLVAELVVTETVLRMEARREDADAGTSLDARALHAAIRRTDWLLVHSIDRQRFTDWLGVVEDR